MMYVVKDESETFEFSSGGAAYEIPAYSDLPLKTIRALSDSMRDAGDNAETVLLEGVIDIIESYAEGSTADLTARQAANLVRAYVSGDDGEQQLGEV